MLKSGNTILITGGNAGIGQKLAEEFHRRGNKIIITGRREDALKTVAGANPGMEWAQLDMQDAAAIEETATRLTRDYPGLNAVIHNAGIMKAEDMKAAPQSLADAEATVTTNLLGPIRLTQHLLPHLLSRPDAYIVTVSSGLAFVPLSATPTYDATKAAIHNYSVALREQLRGTSIVVHEIVPPAVQTDLMPGHAENPHAMPLDDFIAETMGIIDGDAVPDEICTERVGFLRNAEREGRFAKTLAALNGG